MSMISPISAFGWCDTYIEMDSYTAHHGEKVTVKVELFGSNIGIYGTDKWIKGANIDFLVLKKDKNGKISNLVNNVIHTNKWGNAYYTIDTSYLEPGYYGLLAEFPIHEGWGYYYMNSSRTSTLTVT